ncbi:hypothetical protein SESBI_15581 [Sesbania bispinosa]|nr:hypothetical protein SESBI_15581 [Sesbania bispinosa]
MEKREDLSSILPYLPPVMRSSSLFWRSQVVERLRELGTAGSTRAISCSSPFLTLGTLFLSLEPLDPSAALGYPLFFDELMSREERNKWFEEVVPTLGNLLLRLPYLLEAHYENADMVIDEGEGMVKTGLRLLDSQEGGYSVVVYRFPSPLATSLFAVTNHQRVLSLVCGFRGSLLDMLSSFPTSLFP